MLLNSTTLGYIDFRSKVLPGGWQCWKSSVFHKFSQDSASTGQNKNFHTWGRGREEALIKCWVITTSPPPPFYPGLLPSFLLTILSHCLLHHHHHHHQVFTEVSQSWYLHSSESQHKFYGIGKQPVDLLLNLLSFFWGRGKRRTRRGAPGSALKEGNFGRKGALGAESTPDPNTRPIHHLMPVTTRKLRSRYFGPNQELHERRLFCLIFVFNVFELIKTDMKIILHIQYHNLKFELRAIIGTVDQIFPSHLSPTWKCCSRSNITEWRLQATVVHARDQGSNYQRGKATPADTVAGKCLKTA